MHSVCLYNIYVLRMFQHLYICIYAVCLYDVYIYIWMHACVCFYVNVPACLHVCMHGCMCMGIYVSEHFIAPFRALVLTGSVRWVIEWPSGTLEAPVGCSVNWPVPRALVIRSKVRWFVHILKHALKSFSTSLY